MTEEFKKKLASQLNAQQPAIVIKEKENFKKKLDNFWFYNKYKVYVGIFIVIVLIVTISQCASNKKADMSILYVSDYSLTDQQTTAMQNALAKYTTDLDKNGQVVVEITPISVGASIDPQLDEAGQQKLMAELATGDSLVFLVNDEQYKSLLSQNAFENIKKLYPDIAGIEDYRMSWKDLAIRKLPDFKGMPDDMYFVLRKVSGVSGRSKSQIAYEKASESFLKKIISDR